MARSGPGRGRTAMSRFMAILVGTFTDLGEFLYSLFWGRRQARLIREILSSSQPSRDCRVIASLTTLPDRISNLEPTIRSLLEQTAPPEEIVLRRPAASVRQRPDRVAPRYRGR